MPTDREHGNKNTSHSLNSAQYGVMIVRLPTAQRGSNLKNPSQRRSRQGCGNCKLRKIKVGFDHLPCFEPQLSAFYSAMRVNRVVRDVSVMVSSAATTSANIRTYSCRLTGPSTSNSCQISPSRRTRPYHWLGPPMFNTCRSPPKRSNGPFLS